MYIIKISKETIVFNAISGFSIFFVICVIAVSIKADTLPSSNELLVFEEKTGMPTEYLNNFYEFREGEPGSFNNKYQKMLFSADKGQFKLFFAGVKNTWEKDQCSISVFADIFVPSKIPQNEDLYIFSFPEIRKLDLSISFLITETSCVKLNETKNGFAIIKFINNSVGIWLLSNDDTDIKKYYRKEKEFRFSTVDTNKVKEYLIKHGRLYTLRNKAKWYLTQTKKSKIDTFEEKRFKKNVEAVFINHKDHHTHSLAMSMKKFFEKAEEEDNESDYITSHAGDPLKMDEERKEYRKRREAEVKAWLGF